MDKCKTNTALLRELTESYVKLGSKKYIGTARLQLKGHIAKLRQAHTHPVSKELSVDAQQMVTELEETLNSLPTISN